jgi:hypothetical protein
MLEAEQEEERFFSAMDGRFSTTLSMGTAFDAFDTSFAIGADLGRLLRLGHAELEVGTRLGVESGLNHILEITKDAKDTMLGIADFAPASFLCLGRDQEAYDFMKWWITIADTMRKPQQPYTLSRIRTSSSQLLCSCASVRH